MLVLGALVGSRFATITFRLLLGYLGAAFGSFAVSLSVATLFVLIVAHFFPFPIANVAVAFAPGAQDTMMVLALALHLDPVYVAAHHVARFVVTAFSIAIAARWMAGDKDAQIDFPLIAAKAANAVSHFVIASEPRSNPASGDAQDCFVELLSQ